MDNFIEKVNEEQMEILKENGAIDESGKITEQGISLLVCLESDKLYEEMEAISPFSMNIIYRFAEMFIDENKHESLLDMIKEMYLTVELPEPEYLDSLYEQPEQLVFFTEEMAADWMKLRYKQENYNLKKVITV